MRTVLAFELRFRFRQVSTYLFFGILFLLAFLFVATDVVQVGGAGPVKADAPMVMAIATAVLGALGGVIASALAGTAIYRDFEVQAHELFFSTGLSRASYFFGRFVGALLVTLFVYAGLLAGLFVGTQMPWIDPATVGPVRPESYANVFALILLPNVVLMASLFFVFGALTRSLAAIYALGVLLFVGWAVGLSLMAQLDSRSLGALLDPFGLSALRLETRYWSQAERGARLLPLAGPLLANRLLWSAVAAATLALGFRAFRFAARPPAPKGRVRGDAAAPASPAPPVLARVSAGRLWWARTGFFARDIVRSVPFLIIALAGLGMLMVSAWKADTILDNTVWPVTRVMAAQVGDNFMLFFLILIVFYAGELVWRERTLKLDQIHDALPVPTAATVLAKCAALALILAGLTVGLMGAGMLVQLLKGYTRFEPGLYLSYLFGVIYPSLLWLLALAVTVHTLVNHKFLAHTLVLVSFVATQALPATGLDHKLYLFASSHTVKLSDMNGFGPYAAPTFWLHLYWGAASALLLVLAVRMWVRGKDDSLAARWRKGRLTPAGRGVAALAGVVFVAAGAWIFVNTNVFHRYVSEKGLKHLQADYEREYRTRYRTLPQPRVVSASIDVALTPQRGEFVSKGSFALKNRSGQPVTELALTLDPELSIRALALDTPWTPVVRDPRRGFYTFRLARPLPPDASATLTFTLAQDRPGFPNGDPRTNVVANGSFVTMPVPQIGYQTERELKDDSDRRREGLEARPRMPSADDLAARQNTYLGNDADWIGFEATVRTDPDQIAVAPGYLVKEWREGGRRCFRYRMDAPIRNYYTVVSARYAVRRAVWTGRDGKTVALEIFHHPGHEYNLDRILAGAKAALTYCSESFGPYQFRQMRVLEFPAYGTFAEAFPNTVPFSEGIGFILRVSDDPDAQDTPFYVTAHEVAHQWWAHQVLGAQVQGSEMLSESLAQYSALKTLATIKSEAAVERYLKIAQDRYLRGRGSDRIEENPLVRVQGQDYIYYPKGALAFYALSERIGEKRLNAALARFVHDKGFQNPPYTTAPELMAYLRAAAGPKNEGFLADQFEKITLYDLRAVSAKAQTIGARWQVRVEVQASKRYANGKGVETDAPLDEPVTVALRTDGKIIARTVERLTTGTHTVTLECDREPAEAVIDPVHLFIDRTLDDNTAKVTR